MSSASHQVDDDGKETDPTRCIASSTIGLDGSAHQPGSDPAGLFRSVQWSGDGTCLLTQSEDYTLRTYVLPPDLLDRSAPHLLRPTVTYGDTTRIIASAVHPRFDLNNPNTMIQLISSRDSPISLVSVCSRLRVASYPLIDPNTEAYLGPYSLCWLRDGSRFLAGTQGYLNLFDASRDGGSPIDTFRTRGARRRDRSAGSLGMRGITSAMDISCHGILAAGTYSSNIGLFDAEGCGDEIACFQLARDRPSDVYKGRGVSQTLWSPCGKYLYVAERYSDGILIYDIRGTSKRLGVLSGRKARTWQRMGVHVTATESGHEIWAGGTDGKVRIWSDPGSTDGEKPPDHEWWAHDDAVGSAAVHPSGRLAATCSGQRLEWEDNRHDLSDSSESEDSDAAKAGQGIVQEKHDFGLKVWVW